MGRVDPAVRVRVGRLPSGSGHQDAQVPVQLPGGHVLPPPGEHRERRDLQTAQLLLDRPVETVPVERGPVLPHLASREGGEQPLVQLPVGEVPVGAAQRAVLGVVEEQHRQEQRLLGQVSVAQDHSGGQRLRIGSGLCVRRLPHLEEPVDPSLVEGFELDDRGRLGDPGAVGHDRAAGDDDGHGEPHRLLLPLELLDLFEVVGAVDAGGLEQFVEPVQHDHRQRPVGGVRQLPPGHPCVQGGGQALLDLPGDRGVGRDGAQLHPDRQEVRRRQLRGEHLGELGLPGTRVPEDDGRGLRAARVHETGGDEPRDVVRGFDVRPPLLRGGDRVGPVHGDPPARWDVRVSECGQDQAFGGAVVRGQDRPVQDTPVVGGELRPPPFHRAVRGDRAEQAAHLGQAGVQSVPGPGVLPFLRPHREFGDVGHERPPVFAVAELGRPGQAPLQEKDPAVVHVGDPVGLGHGQADDHRQEVVLQRLEADEVLQGPVPGVVGLRPGLRLGRGPQHDRRGRSAQGAFGEGGLLFGGDLQVPEGEGHPGLLPGLLHRLEEGDDDQDPLRRQDLLRPGHPALAPELVPHPLQRLAALPDHHAPDTEQVRHPQRPQPPVGQFLGHGQDLGVVLSQELQGVRVGQLLGHVGTFRRRGAGHGSDPAPGDGAEDAVRQGYGGCAYGRARSGSSPPAPRPAP